jgi:hypothetical protein
MSQPSGELSAHPPNRWQFSLRGLFIFTLSVAIGAAVMQEKVRGLLGSSTSSVVQEKARAEPAPSYSVERLFSVGFCGILLVILTFWMILGLLYQVRDLRCTRVSDNNLCSEHRWGLRFEIFWRLIAAALMLFCVLMVFLLNQRIVSLPIPNDIIYTIRGIISDAVPPILLLAVVGSVSYVRRNGPSSLLHRVLYLIFCALAGILCVELWADHTIIYNLVHIAIVGIDYDQPLRLSSINPRYYQASTNLLFWWSVSSSIVVVINWLILVRLARQWSAGSKRRLTWIVLLVVGVLASSAFLIWLYAWGLKEISPMFAETPNEAPIHYWLSAALLIIVAVTIVTYRLAVDRGGTADTPIVQWRRNPNQYYHEWRTVLLLLIIAIACCFLDGVGILRQIVSQLWLRFFPVAFAPSFKPWADISYGLIGLPIPCLWCAVVLLALQRAFARRPDAGHPASDLPRINPAKFVTIWIATAVVTVSGALVLVWMSFGFWFNPWFRGRWP